MKIQSNYLLRVLKKDFNPFTANNVIVHQDHIEFKKRNNHLISMDSQQLSFDRITGIDINKHLIGATITVKSVGSKPIVVEGLTKANAERIRELWREAKISRGSQNKVTLENQGNGKLDQLEQLGKLRDSGTITEEEFQRLKSELLEG